jgi:FKBP-type peptidyl-prolyl cis-trans isomerase
MARTGSYISLAALAAVVILLSPGCDPSKQLAKDEAEKIQVYLSENPDLHYELKQSGLYYLDEVVGTGALAVTHDTAFFFYTGYFLDGTKFGTNVGTTDTLIYPVNEGWLIQGFDEAITYMKVGGKCKILMPGSLSYYDYTPRLFDINLVKLIPGPGADGK